MTDDKSDESSASKSADEKPGIPAEVPIIQVHELMANSREAVLIHGGERYWLRITAKDKLILTK